MPSHLCCQSFMKKIELSTNSMPWRRWARASMLHSMILSGKFGLQISFHQQIPILPTYYSFLQVYQESSWPIVEICGTLWAAQPSWSLYSHTIQEKFRQINQEKFRQINKSQELICADSWKWLKCICNCFHCSRHLKGNCFAFNCKRCGTWTDTVKT